MLLPNLLKEKGIFGRLALLQMDSLASLTSDLSRQLDQADKHTQSSTADIHALTQLALDRLAQALQVAMANGALLCSRGACVCPNIRGNSGTRKTLGVQRVSRLCVISRKLNEGSVPRIGPFSS